MLVISRDGSNVAVHISKKERPIFNVPAWISWLRSQSQFWVTISPGLLVHIFRHQRVSRNAAVTLYMHERQWGKDTTNIVFKVFGMIEPATSCIRDGCSTTTKPRYNLSCTETDALPRQYRGTTWVVPIRMLYHHNTEVQLELYRYWCSTATIPSYNLSCTDTDALPRQYRSTTWVVPIRK